MPSCALRYCKTRYGKTYARVYNLFSSATSSKNLLNGNETYQSVTEFYAGKSVFITGGTGFLGKVLIEKLLYSCPNINKLFVLIREKKHEDAYQRIQTMVESPVFTRLKEKRPQDIKKIIPIVGDIAAPNLNIKPADENTLINEVSVVFHSAATIKFNESLKIALNINFEGTQKVLNLCKRMKQLKAFVHISTAYTNTDKNIIDEVVYPPPAELDDVYDFVEKYGNDEKKTVTFLNGRPNTYVFTKALAESFILENHGNIPTIIIRPSIIGSAVSEPLKGWVDSWFSSTAVLSSIGNGYCRALLGRGDNIVDIIPVDYVANLTLVAGAKCNSAKKLIVFNCCSSSSNPITLQELFSTYASESTKLGFNDLPYPGVLLTNRRWLVNIIILMTLTIPAYIVDMFLLITGKPKRYVKIASQIHIIRKLLEYFMMNSWVMKASGVTALYNSLSPSDKESFPCDVTDLVWKRYISTYVMGVQQYLINKSKLSSSSIPSKKKNYNTQKE